jgi:hypothetical protein
MRSGSNQRPRRFTENRTFRSSSRYSQHAQTLYSNGPGGGIRGSAQQICQRYLELAREATASGDRIAAENLYQHAEHYFRMSNVHRAGDNQARRFAGNADRSELTEVDVSDPEGFESY